VSETPAVPTVLVVAVALIDPDGRVLIAKRPEGKQLAGLWEFPGGKVEPGEAPEAAVHREIREELGVEVELGGELAGPDDGAWWLTDRYVMRLWLARITEGEPRPLVEHDALRWLPRGQWLTVPWLDADVRIVTALAAATDGARTGSRTL
jgi:8-oxo-dGTP diphosphatase